MAWFGSCQADCRWMRHLYHRHAEVPSRSDGLEARRPGWWPCILRGSLREHLRMTERQSHFVRSCQPLRRDALCPGKSSARKIEIRKTLQADLGGPVRMRKIFGLFCRANQVHSFRRPALTKRGVSRSSRTWGAGCDGRSNVTDECVCFRTAKSCGFGAPTLALTLGVKRPGGTVANKPGHRKEHEGNR